MKVGSARTIATEWVMLHASKRTEFRGAYFTGSTIKLTDEEELPASSDVDVIIVIAQDEPPIKLGKFEYKGILMEVTYLSLNQLTTMEEVLTSYHLAGSFQMNTIIADPTGHLHKLYTQVSRHFTEMEWVRRRCLNALEKIKNGLKSIDINTPLHDKITAWIFPTGVTTHVLLVAALHNPTIRLRYLAAREVLSEYGQTDLYQDLLNLLGCTHLSPQQVEGHLDGLSRTFDATVAVAKTPFFFSSDITVASRQIAIDGSRELIQSGYHHEAVFWIVATFARCHKILDADAPDLHRSLFPSFEAIVADLGITSSDDLIHRVEEVNRFLPRLWEGTEEILYNNPNIVVK